MTLAASFYAALVPPEAWVSQGDLIRISYADKTDINRSQK